MAAPAPRVLLVGRLGAFDRVITVLNQSLDCVIDCANTPRVAAPVDRGQPAFSVLHLPEDPVEQQTHLHWLAQVKDNWPVVVLSNAQDVALCLRAMELGAFDWLCNEFSDEEFQQTFRLALNWQSRKVA